jgi:hypothetical protein
VQKPNQPKARFSARLPSGEFLNLSVWQGKTDPKSEIVRVEVRKLTNQQEWQTVTRIAVFRTSDGRYSQLPDRRRQGEPTANGSAPEIGE